VRPGLPADLPARPGDLGRIRRRRALRIGAKAVGTTIAAAVACGALAWSVRPRRR